MNGFSTLLTTTTTSHASSAPPNTAYALNGGTPSLVRSADSCMSAITPAAITIGQTVHPCGMTTFTTAPTHTIAKMTM